ncbi:rhodanese-like domain-containing protein [bacterium]|jgi:rhodanese-related sulfurtransferase|nr:rhodanese-like domain-containing protein [bacterium]MBT4250874.1 rhodanese-like domain-containing protein [bacterium]MBT4597587.1 rhodanese-like domain-containing protein [bacterium]MBT6754052.1 rhodanese-like domain-containing protein [bacterium]MBT7038082.1 rhodanese-like domain-containing protein [bacterium]
MIKHLSAEEYKELIESKNVWNLDIREGYEFNEERIEGARLVPSTKFEDIFEELKIKKSEKIAVYCRSGARSAFIAQKLSDKGYENIFNLELGLIDWKKNGFNVEK